MPKYTPHLTSSGIQGFLFFNFLSYYNILTYFNEEPSRSHTASERHLIKQDIIKANDVLKSISIKVGIKKIASLTAGADRSEPELSRRRRRAAIKF